MQGLEGYAIFSRLRKLNLTGSKRVEDFTNQCFNPSFIYIDDCFSPVAPITLLPPLVFAIIVTWSKDCYRITQGRNRRVLLIIVSFRHAVNFELTSNVESLRIDERNLMGFERVTDNRQLSSYLVQITYI